MSFTREKIPLPLRRGRSIGEKGTMSQTQECVPPFETIFFFFFFKYPCLPAFPSERYSTGSHSFIDSTICSSSLLLELRLALAIRVVYWFLPSLFLISFFFPYLRSIGVEFLSSSFFSAGNRTIFDWIVYYWKLEKESGLVRGTYSMIGLSFAFSFLFWVNRVDLITSSSPSLNLFKFYSTNTRIRSKIFLYIYAWDKICWQDFY